jgi:hypothetical protein
MIRPIVHVQLKQLSFQREAPLGDAVRIAPDSGAKVLSFRFVLRDRRVT